MVNQFFVLSPHIQNNLKVLGENIRLARLRRNLAMSLICEKARISRPTLTKIEKGDCTVAIGKYAMVLHALGNYSNEFCKVMREDELGRTIQDLNIVTPIRAKKWKSIYYIYRAGNIYETLK